MGAGSRGAQAGRGASSGCWLRVPGSGTAPHATHGCGGTAQVLGSGRGAGCWHKVPGRGAGCRVPGAEPPPTPPVGRQERPPVAQRAAGAEPRRAEPRRSPQVPAAPRHRRPRLRGCAAGPRGSESRGDPHARPPPAAFPLHPRGCVGREGLGGHGDMDGGGGSGTLRTSWGVCAWGDSGTPTQDRRRWVTVGPSGPQGMEGTVEPHPGPHGVGVVRPQWMGGLCVTV